MKVKTSITLEQETLRAVDRLARAGSNRSRVIEAAVIEFVRRRERAAREARDVEIINAHAGEFARMMEDVLAYQTEP
jgi:metal-responsive CopG/Arc/MetJ family transcriptional regulator